MYTHIHTRTHTEVYAQDFSFAQVSRKPRRLPHKKQIRHGASPFYVALPSLLVSGNDLSNGTKANSQSSDRQIVRSSVLRPLCHTIALILRHSVLRCLSVYQHWQIIRISKYQTI